MTIMSGDDTAPTTAVEDALAGLERHPPDDVPRARRSHLTVIDPAAPRTSGKRPAEGTPLLTTDPVGHRAPVAAVVPVERDADPPHRRMRLVPAAAPVRPATAAAPVVPPVPAERARRLGAVAATPASEPDEERGAAPRADAGRFAHGVGLACVEVMLGRRPVTQLARWVAGDVLESLHDRADLARRAGVLTHARRPVARRVRVCPVDTHTAEACLVVDDGVRVRAVALRLEAHRGAWRVTCLEIG